MSFNIQELIYTVRGVQIMLDSDLAVLYGVDSKRLNEQVKRNLERFPLEFRFQLTQDELDDLRSQFATSIPDHNLRFQNGTSSAPHLRSQIVTLKPQNTLRSQNATLETDQSLRSQTVTSNSDDLRGKHRKYLPYAFTEQGVAMLSAVLKSDTAVQASIRIINAFVEMRRVLAASGGLLQRMDSLEKRQVTHESKTDAKFDQVFAALESATLPNTQGIFFDGQIFDAYVFVNDLLRQAKTSVVLIDNYIDDSVLLQLTKRRKGVSATILTKTLSERLHQDLRKHNAQYPEIHIHEFSHSHDRFLILDGHTVYHIGASLKDLGKKWFAFSKLDKSALSIMDRVQTIVKECKV